MNILNKETLEQKIWDFCKHRKLDVSSIFLYGSYALGTAKDTSDVDLIIIDETCIDSYKIQKYFEGYLIQATIFNFQTALNILFESSKASQPFFATSYDMAEVIYDKTGLAQYLKEVSAHVLNLGPFQPSEQFIETKRLSLINYLNNGKKEKYTGKSTAEAVLWASRVIEKCEIQLLIHCKQWRMNNPRFRAEILQANFPEVIAALHRALMSLIDTSDKAAFAAEAKEIMGTVMSFNEESSAPHCSVV